MDVDIGDRLLYIEDGHIEIMTILKRRADRPTNFIGWTTDCDNLNKFIYDDELIDENIDGHPLIKIENDQHLLMLQLKYT